MVGALELERSVVWRNVHPPVLPVEIPIATFIVIQARQQSIIACRGLKNCYKFKMREKGEAGRQATSITPWGWFCTFVVYLPRGVCRPPFFFVSGGFFVFFSGFFSVFFIFGGNVQVSQSGMRVHI